MEIIFILIVNFGNSKTKLVLIILFDVYVKLCVEEVYCLPIIMEINQRFTDLQRWQLGTFFDDMVVEYSTV